MIQASSAIGNVCNLLAMSLLQDGTPRCRFSYVGWCSRHAFSAVAEGFEAALELLQKAKELLKEDPKGLAVTYNNLACFHRRYALCPMNSRWLL